MSTNSKPISGPSLFLSFWKTSRTLIKADQQSISRLGFSSLSDFAVLEVLLHKGPLPVNTIGEKVLLTSGSITTAVQRLETQGLVKRRQDQKDRRVVEVHLTPEGKERIETAFAQHAGELDKLFAPLSDKEKKKFLKILKKLRSQARLRLLENDGPQGIST